MAYEMKDNTFRFEYSPENIGKKFPVLKAGIKVNGNEFNCAAWAREGKYGTSFFGDATQLIPLLRAMLGSGIAPKKKEAQTQTPEPEQPSPEPEKPPIDRSTLIR